MKPSPVQIPPFDPEFAVTVGPMAVDRRSRQLTMTELGAGFAEFTEAGSVGPEPLPYEEMLYVLEGELTITFDDNEVVGRPGDMLLLEKGVMATFTATKGTRLVYSLVPWNYRERTEHAE